MLLKRRVFVLVEDYLCRFAHVAMDVLLVPSALAKDQPANENAESKEHVEKYGCDDRSRVLV